MRFAIALVLASAAMGAEWQMIEPQGEPLKRHECAFVEAGGKLYLIGGRGEKPVNVYDPATNRWTDAAQPPIEIHHFQPVVVGGRIYVMGALTGKYPHETPIENVLIFDPARNAWSEGPAIPEEQRRGAAGAAVYKGKIYLSAGIVDGHWDGHVKWLDAFDPKTAEWEKLADAPRPRDHFQATVIGDKMYLAGGRRSSAKTGDTFKLSVGEVDVYDFKTGTWSTAEETIPTERARVVLGGVEGTRAGAGRRERGAAGSARGGRGVRPEDGGVGVAAGVAARPARDGRGRGGRQALGGGGKRQPGRRTGADYAGKLGWTLTPVAFAFDGVGKLTFRDVSRRLRLAVSG